MCANPGWQRVLHRPPTLLEVFLAAVGWQRNQFTAGVWVSNLQHQLCYKYIYYSTGNCAACAPSHEWVMWAGEIVTGFTFVFKPKHLFQSLSTKFTVRCQYQYLMSQCVTHNKDVCFKEPLTPTVMQLYETFSLAGILMFPAVTCAWHSSNHKPLHFIHFKRVSEFLLFFVTHRLFTVAFTDRN